MEEFSHVNLRHLEEIGLFLEEVCFNLCLLGHVRNDGISLDRFEIHQEVDLGRPGAFADLKVELPDRSVYYIEVKWFYLSHRLLASLLRKYGELSSATEGGGKVILVLDTDHYSDWPKLHRQIVEVVHPSFEIEIWDEPELLRRIKEILDVEIDDIRGDRIYQIREAIQEAKGRAAFGDAWVHNPLQNALLWHFGIWRLNLLQREVDHDPTAIMPAGLYEDVAVVIADLCSFSSYVRDTRDSEVVSQCLTSFYAKARYEIINAGGMLYLYVGDAVIAFFGLPMKTPNYMSDALACAESLIDIGKSVSHDWQRKIDRKQETYGVHIGMALGDVDIVPLQPFERAHLGAVSDSINMASRLLEVAGPDEIVVSNTCFQALNDDRQALFERMNDVDAKNLGKILSWKWAPKNRRRRD